MSGLHAGEVSAPSLHDMVHPHYACFPTSQKFHEGSLSGRAALLCTLDPKHFQRGGAIKSPKMRGNGLSLNAVLNTLY